MAMRYMMRAAAFCLPVLMIFAHSVAAQEVQMPPDDYKKLDTFEAHLLSRADKSFNDKSYRRAATEYDSFLLEFPRSSAIPYALLRKARCLHIDNKRFEALREYRELLDYFPNEVAYAAPALYYIGLAHWQNRDEQEAMTAWAQMAEDAEYRKHYLAADAINRLADYFKERNQRERAIGYYRQVAVDFRSSNQDAANKAIDQVIPFYVRDRMSEPDLRKFYEEVRTFDRRPRSVPDDLDNDKRYWDEVRNHVKRNGSFTDLQRKQSDSYYRYWAGVMEGRFEDHDDYQIDLADFHLKYERDAARWMARLDQQFQRGFKAGDFNRIIKWIGLYSSHPAKIEEYYKKIDFSKMDNNQIRSLMETFYEKIKDRKIARNCFSHLRFDKMSDDDKARLVSYMARRDEAVVEPLCRRFDDEERGKMELLKFYHGKRDVEKGLPVADELSGSERYAESAIWLKAELLQNGKRYSEAIQAYRQSTRSPDNFWRISECYARMGRLEQALAQLREIESFFEKEAPEAVLRAAYLFRDAGQRDRYVSELRAVLRKYPESGQSRTAHLELERLGESRLGGGTDAE